VVALNASCPVAGNHQLRYCAAKHGGNIAHLFVFANGKLLMRMNCRNRPRRLPPLLRRAWYGLNQIFRQRIAHLNLTPDQFTVLRWLDAGDPRGLTQQELTKLMASDPNTVAALMKRMEAAGLISRSVHESDRRAHRVRLQPAGVRRFQAAAVVARALEKEVLRQLPVKARDQFLANLETVAAACQETLETTAASASGRRTE
jgi:DNA-binding MarR family transcriptional regulator